MQMVRSGDNSKTESLSQIDRFFFSAADNVMDFAELINSELKFLNRWLKSNKICINADKTKNMLFSYNKNVNFIDISVGNNTINKTSVTQFLDIHLDKKNYKSYN